MSALLWHPGRLECHVSERVVAMVARSLGISRASVTPQKTAEDLGADSLDWAQILLIEVEAEFNVYIGDARGVDLLTVGDLITCVLRRLKGAAL